MLIDNELYRGRIDQIADRKLTSVRIFISSTFTDTTEERDSLIQSIYPKLREYCRQKYKIQFQYSDMRWGIQEKAADEHSTTDMCLYELDQCCRFSLATNCVIFLGHRYGSRMAPAHMTQRLFDALLSVLSDDDRRVLMNLYQLDENPLEPVYVLRPVNPAEKKAWRASEQQLQTILRQASDLCLQAKTISEDDRNKFHISVTADEIYRALSNNQNRPQRVVAIFREIEDIDQFEPKLQEKFTDETDQMTKALLNEIKTTIRNALPEENILTYKVKWMDKENRAGYLVQFQNDFFSIIQRQIDFHMSQIRPKGILYDEVLEHAIHCKILHERYFPRDEIFEQVKSLVVSDSSRRPIIIHGKSGTGKSSLMAEIAIKAPSWFENPDSISVVLRFLGTTPLSSDIRRPLISIIRQICTIYHIDQSLLDENSATVEQLKEILQTIVYQIPKNERLILLFDSIDQLQIEYFDCSKWLPVEYPENVRCILSTIPVITEKKIDYQILEDLQTLLGKDAPMIEISTFDESIARKVFHSWLERDQRRLTPVQMEWMEPKLKPYTKLAEPQPTPLFLSLLYDITLTWHSYDEKADPDFLSNVATGAAIRYLYFQLCRKHGELLFLRSMAYLRKTGGLNDVEMEDILSADNEILQSIFVHYLPPLNIFRLPSSLWIRIRNDISKYLVEKNVDETPVTCFYHRSFRQSGMFGGGEGKEVEYIRRAYFAGPIGQFPNLNDRSFEIKSKKLIDRNHGNAILSVDRCLTKQLPFVMNNKRKMKSYNMRRINQLCVDMENLCCEPYFLYDYDFLSNYLRFYKIRELRTTQWFYEELRFLLTLFDICAFILDNYPENFAFEFSLRLSRLIHILPKQTYNLFKQCLNHTRLFLLENPNPSIDVMKSRCIVGNVLDTAIDRQCNYLFLLLPNKILGVHFLEYFLTGRVDEHSLPSNEFNSIKCNRNYVCAYSKKSLWIFQCDQTRKCVLQREIDRLIHVDFLANHVMLICSNEKKLIEIWNCLKEELIEQYSFEYCISQCDTFRTAESVVIKTKLDTGLISYLSFEMSESDGKVNGCFKQIGSLANSLGEESVLLNSEMDVYYSKGDSSMQMHHFRRSGDECLEKLDRLPPITNPIYHHCISSGNKPNTDTALIWLTEDSIVILHSCGKYFLIPGEYHIVCKTSRQMDCHFICGLNRNSSTVTIFEWKCVDQIHSYRQLVSIQVDEKVSHCVFDKDDESGFSVYTVHENGELQKYYATVMTYLTDKSPIVPEKSFPKEQIDLMQIYGDFLVTLDQTKSSLRLFTIADHLSFLMDLEISTRIAQFALLPAYILLLDSYNTLYLYSISSTPELLFKTNELKLSVVKLYSLASSFIILDGYTRQIFELNPLAQLQLHVINNIEFPHRSLLSDITHDRFTIFILSDNYSTFAKWNSITHTIEYYFIQIHLKTTIEQVYAISSALVFRDSSQRIHLNYLDDIQNRVTLGRADLVQTTANRLALFDSSTNKLITYDISKKLRGEIQLEIFLDALCFTEDGEYLFGISEKESLLFMYQVNTGKCLEKLFIENLSGFIQATIDRLIVTRRDEILLMGINMENNSRFERTTDEPPIKCPLFEENQWFDCHSEEPWKLGSAQNMIN